jgi:hypothetical protein
VLMRSPRDDPATDSGGVSRLSKAVLVAYMVIMSILAIDVLVTEGIGKSAVGPIGALIIGVILWLRTREASKRGPTV